MAACRLLLCVVQFLPIQRFAFALHVDVGALLLNSAPVALGAAQAAARMASRLGPENA